MIKRDKLIAFINKTLNYEKDKDPYGPNSLQVYGKEEVRKVALGVSANLELFKKAASWGTDMIIVHHGLFWEMDERVIKKVMKNRLKILFDNDITLLGYHYFLDSHPVLGNNAQMIKLLGAKIGKEFGKQKDVTWGFEGRFPSKLSFDELMGRIKKRLKIKPRIFAYGPEKISRIGVVSGGGAYIIKEAIDANLDVYITGEPAESIEALTKEAGIHFIYLGHYNSEKFGIKALGKVLKKKFPKLEIKFIDIPNPL